MRYCLSKRGIKKCLRTLFLNIKEDDEYQLVQIDKNLYEIIYKEEKKKVYLYEAKEPYFRMRIKEFRTFLENNNVPNDVIDDVFKYHYGEDVDIKKINQYFKDSDLYDKLFDYFFPTNYIDVILLTNDDCFIIKVEDYKKQSLNNRLSYKGLQIGSFRIKPYAYADLFITFRIRKLPFNVSSFFN